MDRFVKRYMVPKTDQYGNVVYKDGEKVMVQSKSVTKCVMACVPWI